MSDTNGDGRPPASVEQLEEQLRRERLCARLAKATHERALWESVGGLAPGVGFGLGWGDILSPFTFRRDDFGRAWMPLNQGGVSAKRDGRNAPFFESDTDLDAMRALAQWLTTRNDLAIGAVRTIRNLTIKQGYKWEAKPAKGYENDARVAALARRVQRVIDLDADLNKLASRERSSCWRAVRDGEAFVRHFAQDDGTTRHRFVRAEQVRDPGNFGPHCSFGIETEEGDVEEVTAYHVTYDGTAYDRVPACEMSHLKRNVDEEIKRGVSDFYSAGESFDDVAKLLRGMRRGATLLSKIAWIEEFANTTGAQISAHSAGLRDLNVPRVEDPRTGRPVDTQYMADGTVIRTKDNKKYQPPPLAGNTANFVSVVQAALRACGVRWGFPEYFISGDASNNNYASILVAGSPLVNGVECDQEEFGQFFLRWRWVAVKNACAANVVGVAFETVERVIDLTFTPPKVAIADEAGQAEIDHKDLAAGVLSLQTRRARRNLDDEQERKNLREEPPTRVAGKATDLDPAGNPTQPPGPARPAAVRESAADGDSEDADAADPGTLADLFYGLYGERALSILKSLGGLTEGWDAASHPRGKGGRFIPKGSAEAVAAATSTIGRVLKGDATVEPKELLDHLSILTVKQINELAKKHGKTAPKLLRAELVDAVRQIMGQNVAAAPPKEEPKQEPAAAKEPWQMTRKEYAAAGDPKYAAARRNTHDTHVLGADARGEKLPPAVEKEYAPLLAKARARRAEDAQKETGADKESERRRERNDFAVKNPEQVSRYEFTHYVRDPDVEADLKKYGGGTIRADHYAALHRKTVEAALAAGKTVPPEVLADYPDLAKKAAPEPGPAAKAGPPAAEPAEPKPLPRGALGAPVVSPEELAGFADLPKADEAFAALHAAFQKPPGRSGVLGMADAVPLVRKATGASHDDAVRQIAKWMKGGRLTVGQINDPKQDPQNAAAGFVLGGDARAGVRGHFTMVKPPAAPAPAPAASADEVRKRLLDHAPNMGKVSRDDYARFIDSLGLERLPDAEIRKLSAHYAAGQFGTPPKRNAPAAEHAAYVKSAMMGERDFALGDAPQA